MNHDELDLLREAAYDGKRCGNCGKALEPDEAVYRQCYHWDILHGHKAPFCEACAHDAYKAWHDSPCDGCGRPVFEQDFRSRRLTVCSQRCRILIETQQRKAKRQAARRSITCAACSVEFMPQRSGATTCSNACRQWLYRKRRYSKCLGATCPKLATVTEVNLVPKVADDCGAGT